MKTSKAKGISVPKPDEIKKDTIKVKEDIQNKTCSWPGCNKDKQINISLPVFKPNKQNIPEPVKDMTVPFPFCKYHIVMVSCGFCGALQNPEDPKQFAITAPVEMVKIAEAVVSGLIFTGELSKLIKNKEKAEQDIKKMQKQFQEKQENEKQTKDDKQEESKQPNSDGNNKCVEVQQRQVRKPAS